MKKTDFRNEPGVICYTPEKFKKKYETDLPQLEREVQESRVVIVDEDFEFLSDVLFLEGRIQYTVDTLIINIK